MFYYLVFIKFSVDFFLACQLIVGCLNLYIGTKYLLKTSFAVNNMCVRVDNTKWILCLKIYNKKYFLALKNMSLNPESYC